VGYTILVHGAGPCDECPLILMRERWDDGVFGAEAVSATALRAACYLGQNAVEILDRLVSHVRAVSDVALEFDETARSSPEAATELTASGLVWACGLLSVEMIRAGALDAEIVAAPVFVGQQGPVYHSVIVARPDSGYRRLGDAVGGRLGVNEPESWSGHHGLVDHLGSIGLTIGAFAGPVPTGSHVNSARAVIDNDADVAAIDHTIWEHLVAKGETDDLVVLERTRDWPAPPFSLDRSLDAEVRNKLLDALTSVEPGDVGGLVRIVPATQDDYEFMATVAADPSGTV